MSTAPGLPDVGSVLARVESLLAGGIGPRVPDQLDPASIRWVCLVPVWTPTLAARCAMPGWGSAADLDVLEAWRDDGLIEATLTPLSIDDAGQVTPAQHLFWVSRHARPAWLSRIIEEDGLDALASLVQSIASRVLAQPRDQHMPTATWRWAFVASHATSTLPTLREAFEHELDQALSQERPEEAWLWIEALQRVAEVVPGEATTLHQRAVRRLALFDRQRSDRAMLRGYLPRRAMFEAYRDLLTGPDGVWAMHYLGGGGVGKTMLMRALTSGTDEHLPPGVVLPPTVTARIDFDHINPDYPARRPGLLIAHLAEELRLKDDRLAASEAFALLFSKIALLHERVDSDRTPAADVEEMLEVFRWACESVASGGRRIVLLLDTCEELDRLGPSGSLPDSVERTFALLERLHEMMPALRVVLCGRRPLAGTYADGEVVVAGMPERPWLRLHRVFAFSGDEARTYLQLMSVPEALVVPVLARSVAAASSATLGLPAGEASPRYSPFSLSVYATWIAKQQDVDPARIVGDDVDHFVRIRILDRIHNEDVRRLLPHVALLGRFDDATLRACVDIRADVADAVLREIAAQEWIDRQAGGYYAVEPELRLRLWRYFEREETSALDAARRRVLPALWQRLDAGPVGEVPDEAVVQALLQLVHADRASVLRAWHILDPRVTAGAESAWGVRVLGRVLADEASLGAEVDPGARAACLTTYAECVLREHGAAGTAELWATAWEGAQHLTPPDVRAGVLVRAASGGLTCAAASLDLPAIERWASQLSRLIEDPDVTVSAPSHLAPVIAAVMACLDAAERQADPLAPAPSAPWLASLTAVTAEVSHAPARAIALACAGRLAARHQEVHEARSRFEDALDAMTEPGDGQLPLCLQWPRRLDAASWVSVESLRGLAGLEPVEDTLARFPLLMPVASEVAANRLEALRLRLTAAVRVPEAPPTGAAASPLIRPDDVAIADSLGLAVVPPRAVALALDHVECGRPEEGLRLLAELASVATSARNTVVAVAVDRARIAAVTRMRLGEHGRLSRQLLAGASEVPLVERERMRAFIHGRTVNDESARPLAEMTVVSLDDAHAIWRARRAPDAKAREDLAAWGRRVLTGPPAGSDSEWARASAALDLIECAELGGVDRTGHGLTPISPEAWWSRFPAHPELALRLWTRSAALGVSPGGPTTQLVRRIGVRRAAAIAMEEGELLALRLPAHALRLLALALTWFEDASDALGIWQVTALLAITRVRSGVPRDALDLTALREAHEVLVACVAGGARGLPSWSVIEGISRLPLTEAPGLTEWTPWLHRVIVVQHWVASGVRPEVMFSAADALPVELRDWPSEGAAAGQDGTAQTPVTSSGITLPSDPPTLSAPAPPSYAPTTAPSPAGAPTRSPRSGSRLAWPWWALGGLATVLAAGLLVGWLVTTTSRSDAPTMLPPGATVDPGQTGQGTDEPGANATSEMTPLPVLPLAVAMVLLAAGAAIWGAMRRRAPATRASGGTPTWVARVTSTDTDGASDRLAALDTTVTLADERGEPVTVAHLRIRRIEALSGLDALRQPPLGTALSSPLPRTPPLERMWLDLETTTAWPCWEALLWSGTVDVMRLRPFVVRAVRGARAARPLRPATGAPWTIATIAATAGDARQASYAWEPAVRARRASVTPVPADVVREGVRQRDIRVVHVAAQPIDTPQGLFFEVTGGEDLHVKESLESLRGDRGTLFDASQIAHTFPDMVCAVLQPPRRASLDLTPAGRETCASLRVIGAALAEEGVPFVVVLPPLDGELSSLVVRLLGRRLATLSDSGTLDPHEFLLRAREMVLGHAQRLLPRDAAIELALQVTVYAR